MKRILLSVLLVSLASQASAVVLEDFQGAWAGPGNVIVDPYDPAGTNMVLHLTGGEVAAFATGTSGLITMDIYDFGATAFDNVNQNSVNPGTVYGPRWGVGGDAVPDANNRGGSAAASIINTAHLTSNAGYGYSIEASRDGDWFTPNFFHNPRRLLTSPAGQQPIIGDGLQQIGTGTPIAPEIPGSGAWTVWQFDVTETGDVTIDALEGTTGKYLDAPYTTNTQNTWSPTPGAGGDVQMNIGTLQEVWVSGGHLNGNPNQDDDSISTFGLLVDNITFDGVISMFNEADFNTDGSVDGVDFLAWQNGFGTMGAATKAQGDFNNDGNVDGVDFLGWQNNFGTGAGSAAVPEPSTLGLLALGCVAVLLRRRRS